MLRKIRPSAGYFIAGLLLFFIINPFVQTHIDLKNVAFQVQWLWLVLSLGVLLFYRTLYTVPFATLLSGITKKRVSFRSAFTLFHLANITRYLPGRIWGVVRLLSLSHRFDLSKTETASSLTLHVGIETTLGGLIALSLLFSKQMRETAIGILEKFSGHTLLLTLAFLCFMVGVAFLIPKLAKQARRFLKTFVLLLQNSCLFFNLIVGHLLLWCCQGLAFFLFVRSLFPVLFSDVGLLTACYAFAWIVGFLSFLTPGGLGIRDGLLGLLLTHYMLASQATFIALLCRLWMLSAEILLAGTAFLLQRKTRCLENT